MSFHSNETAARRFPTPLSTLLVHGLRLKFQRPFAFVHFGARLPHRHAPIRHAEITRHGPLSAYRAGLDRLGTRPTAENAHF